MRQILDFNSAWSFALGNRGDYSKDFGYGYSMKPFAKAGEFPTEFTADFDESKWTKVDLPHDWTVGLRPVYSQSGTANSHGYKPFGAEYPEYCIGWYRKSFTLDETYRSKKVFFEFDGAYRDMQLWINGIYLGRNESGYIGDRYDLSDMIYFDRENVLIARLDASQNEGWFYEGCGIYRPVRLIVTDGLRIDDTDVFVHSDIKNGNAVLTAEFPCVNENGDDAAYAAEVLICEGDKVIASAKTDVVTCAFGKSDIKTEIAVDQPKLWSPDEPNLYKVTLRIVSGNTVTDEYSLNHGFRTIVFDPDKGLFINGKSTKVKGVCCHQDHAGVGSAISESLYEYRVALLKEMGANGYRCSHNPPSPALLDIFDREGMLVMDENRLLTTGKETISQFERLVKRDRNHPSVFIWSIANEEGFIQDRDIAARMGKTLRRLVYRLDGTRPVTYAPNNGATESGINSVVDVRGWNYMAIGGIGALDNAHEKFPGRPILGTEEASTVSTRGIWFSEPAKGYVEDYGETVPGWGSTAEAWWSSFAERDHLLGSFVWTGFDYRGEPTPYTWPNVTSHFGIMDMCGFPKSRYYYYKANWTDEDVLHICPDWNINVAEGTPIKVKCFTNCDHVTLFLNGTEVGSSDVEKYQSVYFTVNYAKGVLKAVGTRNGKEIEAQVETADEASVFEISSRSFTACDKKTTVFTVQAKDSKGRFNAQCDRKLNLSAENGRIIGVGNGDPSDHECDLKTDSCRFFKGLMSVIVCSEPNQEPVLSVEKA